MTVTKLETAWGFWIYSDLGVLAGLVSSSYSPKGVEFVTPTEQSLQVAVMNREKGFEIPAHEHLPVGRALEGTQEVLILRSGVLRVDIYERRAYVGSFLAQGGDVVILVGGGHGFVTEEECQFLEVKQGPYVQARDKVIFSSVTDHREKVRYIT